MNPAEFSMLCKAGILVIHARLNEAWEAQRKESGQTDIINTRKASEKAWAWAALYLLTALLGRGSDDDKSEQAKEGGGRRATAQP
jgi:glucokinase